MTNYTEWDDISHYQGGFNCTRFTLAKATEGTNFADDWYPRFKAQCATKKLPFAAYHFLLRGNAKAQAAWAYKNIGKVPAMLDIEYSSVHKTSPSLQDSVDFITEYRRLGGVMNFIYLPHWFWKGTWGSPNLGALTKLGQHNINSNYSAGSKEQGSPAWTAFGGMPVTAVQFTSTPHDMNRAYMTASELWTLWTGIKAPTYVHPAGSRQLMLTSPQMDGHDVVVAQQKIGVAHAGKADGIFGPTTKSGVVWWQRQHHITDDGIVGPVTWATMGIKYTGK